MSAFVSAPVTIGARHSDFADLSAFWHVESSILLATRPERVRIVQYGNEVDFMKLKDGFVLREVAGSYMVAPVGKRTAEIPGVIALTETGAVLWKLLEQGATEDELVSALLDEYEVSADQAAADVHSFIEKAGAQGLLEE